MKRKCLILVFAIMGLSFAACGPSTRYGRLAIDGQEMTIDKLAARWQDYHISYAGVDVNIPNAILFDPKGDDKTITLQKYWSPVHSHEELRELLGSMLSFTFYPPRLYKVIGPNNQVFGYLYTLDTEAHIKVINDKTLWIDDMTLRPSAKQGGFISH